MMHGPINIREIILSLLPKRREIVIPLSGFIPKADLTLVPPATNAHNLELDKTAVESTKKKRI